MNNTDRIINSLVESLLLPKKNSEVVNEVLGTALGALAAHHFISGALAGS